MARIDITVRGAGAFGLSVAWACVQRGARVRIVDPHGVGAGSSGGVVGALAPHVPENWNDKKAFQLESLLMAQGWWDAVEAAGALSPGYARTGRVQPVMDARALDLARGREDTAKDLWQGRATWTLRRAEGGWEPHSPTGWLIFDTLSAHLHPLSACRALAAACVARGAEIVPEAEREGVEVWATGAAGLRALSEELGQVVGVPVKGQAATLECDMGGAPQIFADGVHIIPHLNGTVAIGSTTERDVTDLSTDAQLDEVIARARAAVPVLADAPVVQRWAGLRPRARSRAPMMGRHPTQDGVFIANGGFKIGFGMAPLIAEVMADLIMDGADRIPEAFSVAANLK